VSAGRVLVVDDDPRIAELLRLGLNVKGLEVTVADDGSRGREVWAAGGFDLVLLDVMLPGIDGISLCEERRAAGDRTPVILLTAREDEEARARGMAAGATDYMTKPFVYPDLISRIALLLPQLEAS
jgi:DNA-binding response OmpR family regulator